MQNYSSSENLAHMLWWPKRQRRALRESLPNCHPFLPRCGSKKAESLKGVFRKWAYTVVYSIGINVNICICNMYINVKNICDRCIVNIAKLCQNDKNISKLCQTIMFWVYPVSLEQLCQRQRPGTNNWVAAWVTWSPTTTTTTSTTKRNSDSNMKIHKLTFVLTSLYGRKHIL